MKKIFFLSLIVAIFSCDNKNDISPTEPTILVFRSKDSIIFIDLGKGAFNRDTVIPGYINITEPPSNSYIQP